MQIAPIDIVLLLVALAACGYCFMLNRRLRALHDTRKGVGAAILALSDTISKMNTVSEASNRQAKTAAEALELQMRLARELATKLDRLVQDGQKTSEEIAGKMQIFRQREENAALLFDEGAAPTPPRMRHPDNTQRYRYGDDK